MMALVAYAETNGPTFWLLVAGAGMALEVMSGRGWMTWAAIGAVVAAALAAWLKLGLGVATAAFAAATTVGVIYGLRVRAVARAAQRL